MTKSTTAVEHSRDSKLSEPDGSGMSATYAQQSTCPPTCALFKAGCYAEQGHVGFTTHRLNSAPAATPAATAKAEAKQIGALSGTRHLRVHVVGDCRTPAAARIIGTAMVKHTQRRGKGAWTYTHAWRDVDKTEWSGASVLASCETPEQARAARAKQYPVALIVPKHASRQVYRYKGLRVLPCPAQFQTVQPDGTMKRGTHCEHCAICREPEHLRDRGLVLGFEVDPGTRVNTSTLQD